jgi:hypothetical protein
MAARWIRANSTQSLKFMGQDAAPQRSAGRHPAGVPIPGSADRDPARLGLFRLGRRSVSTPSCICALIRSCSILLDSEKLRR